MLENKHDIKNLNIISQCYIKFINDGNGSNVYAVIEYLQHSSDSQLPVDIIIQSVDFVQNTKKSFKYDNMTTCEANVETDIGKSCFIGKADFV